MTQRRPDPAAISNKLIVSVVISVFTEDAIATLASQAKYYDKF